MWFIALVFIATPVVLVGWWLKLLYANRNVPNPPSFGKKCCDDDNEFLNEGFESDDMMTDPSFSNLSGNIYHRN